MSLDISIFGFAAALTLGIQLCGFVVAYLLQTEVFYDILGGINFLCLAVLGIIERWSTTASPRLIAVTTIFCLSRGWLLLFLAWRAHNRKGDSRFDGVKDHFFQFLVYWLAQAFWVFLISWPLIVVQALDSEKQQQPAAAGLSTYDIVMLLGFAVGVVTEIVADIQKTLWVNGGRKGTFCTVGLWNYSRHPNYFGEIFQWRCAWLLSYGSLADYSTPSTAAIVLFALGSLSPLFTMNILLNMEPTGVWNAEGKSLKRYYDSEDGEAYKEYRASTSPLIPMVGYKHIPLPVKRAVFFEWKRFEYNSNGKKKE